MSEYLILRDAWYTPHDGACIGIITILVNGEIKSYIGHGIGINREHDMHRIVASGVPFSDYSTLDLRKEFENDR